MEILTSLQIRDAGVQGYQTTTDTNNKTLVNAPGPGKRILVTDVTVMNKSATNTGVLLKSGTNALWPLPAPANGGCVYKFKKPLELNENEALNMAALDAATTIYLAAAGYTVDANYVPVG